MKNIKYGVDELKIKKSRLSRKQRKLQEVENTLASFLSKEDKFNLFNNDEGFQRMTSGISNLSKNNHNINKNLNNFNVQNYNNINYNSNESNFPNNNYLPSHNLNSQKDIQINQQNNFNNQGIVNNNQLNLTNLNNVKLIFWFNF